jgi:CheY-like chemotaxis protein
MVRHVVLIEDDEEIAELLRVVLSSPEIELHSAENGPDGLALSRDLNPELIVLDIMLPGMDGWEVYDTIRSDDVLNTIPVIVLSVTREKPDRRQAFATSEIDVFISKPFDTLQLRGEIERMLRQKGLWKPPTRRVARAFGVSDEASAPPPSQAEESPPAHDPAVPGWTGRDAIIEVFAG